MRSKRRLDELDVFNQVSLSLSLQKEKMELRPAILLLLCPNATLLEIKGTQRTPLDTGDLQVITMETSPEDKLSISAQLGMDPGLVPKEIAFASCGSHRIPLNKSYPCLAMEERLFVFALPGMMLGLQIAPDADTEELDVLNGILSEHCNLRRKEVKVTTMRMLTRSAVTISATMAQTAVGVTMLLADQVVNHVTHSEHASKRVYKRVFFRDPRFTEIKKVGLAALGVTAEVLLCTTASTKAILKCSADPQRRLSADLLHRTEPNGAQATRKIVENSSVEDSPAVAGKIA